MKEIKLSDGTVAIVSDDDYGYLSQWKWQDNKGYAYRCTSVNGKHRSCTMHRVVAEVIFGDISGKSIDHINADKRDNRRENLRIATTSQNQMNLVKFRGNSKFKGVHYKKARSNKYNLSKPWESRINKDGKFYFLGLYKTEEEAAKAYNKKAIELFGEFARINQLP